MDQTQIESLGKVIATLSKRIAIGILMEATKDDYLYEIEEELDELSEAVEMLEMLEFPIPKLVNEVFRLHIDLRMDEMKDN